MNYYEILGVAQNASDQDIKEAYRREAMKWHPDRHDSGAGKAEAERRFKMLAEAYRVLRDAAMRTEYDDALRRDSSSERNDGSSSDGSAAGQRQENSSADRAAADQESADAIFFEQMLDLAFDLASRGFASEKITSALTSLGCPESMAKAVANLATKRNGEKKAPEAPTGQQSANGRKGNDSRSEWKLDYYKAITHKRFQDYYLKAFKAFDNQPGKLFTLPNIGALLLQFGWLAYKGMWKYAAIYAALWCTFALVTLEIFSDSHVDLIHLLVFLSFSLFANALYHRHVNKLIDKARSKSPEKTEQIQLLRRQSQKSSRFFFGSFVSIAILGILLGVAIPANQEYSSRAVASSGLSMAKNAAQQIDDYIRKNKFPPQSLEEAGFTPPLTEGIESIEYFDSVDTIEVKFGNNLANTNLLLVRRTQQTSTTWLCGSETLKPTFLPISCRDTQDAAITALQEKNEIWRNFSDKLKAILQRHPELDEKSPTFSEANFNWFDQKYLDHLASGMPKVNALEAAEIDYSRAIQPSQAQQGSNAERISLNFVNIEFKALLQVISDVARINFIADDLVQFSTSIRIIDTPWDTIVINLLERHNLTYLEGRNGYYIYPSSMTQDLARRRATARGFQ